MTHEADRSELLKPYVPRLLIEWLRETPEERYREVDGSLAFVDISGFTKMTERLARKGKVGAEEVSDTLNTCFTELLSVAYDYGAGLVKWGGDAVLLLFDGLEHAPRAARAAAGMQRTLRAMGRLRTSAGLVTLRMSIGIHSDSFHFFLAGDVHRELVIAGTAATATVDMETIAEAGEVVLSPGTVALLDPAVVGKPKGAGFLLRGEPDVAVGRAAPVLDVGTVDLARCLPVGIREHLLADAGDAEHRPLATAFIEFGGTDDLLLARGPEALAEAIDETITKVQDAALQHEVVFSETDISRAGGKILLIAGAPRTVGDEEERMLRTARAIMDDPGRLPLRIGVNCGRVFAGDFGPPYRRTYSVKGDALNTAARIMGKAAPGQIFATEEVLARSRTRFRTTPVGPFTLKGKAAPLPAFEVGEILGRDDGDRTAPLVGREAELAILLEALASARAGAGRVVELIGEPGIGKSRLVDEVRSGATDLTVIDAPSEQYERLTAYFPVSRALRTILRIRDQEIPARVEQRLRRTVEAVAPDLLPWLPLIGLLLDLELEPTPETAQLEETFRRQRLGEVASELLRRALATPTVLVFEDAHWMDEPSAELLRHLAGRVADVPWLVLTTRRDVDTGFVAPEGSHTTSLRLEPLAEQDTAVLIRAATADARLPPHVVVALARKAGGNPLFLTELAGAARAGGLETLPDSVEALLSVQIDRLAPRDRTVLRYASVLGVNFPQDLLRAALEGQAYSLDDGAWERIGDLVQRDRSGIARFRHALVRDTAYEGLPFKRRRELHGRVGDTIVRLAGSDPDEQAELLSLHFFHAQRFDDSWRYSRIAGQRAEAKYAKAEAAEFYRRALASARPAGAAPADMASIREALGDVCDRIGLFEEATATFRRARRDLRGSVVDEARLLLKEAMIAEQAGHRLQAVRAVKRALRSLDGDESRPAVTQRAHLAVWYAYTLYRQGRYGEALRWSERSADEAETAGDRASLAWAYMLLELLNAELGLVDEIPYGRLALLIYEELGDLPRQASALTNLGARAFYEGRWEEAVASFERAADLYVRTGNEIDRADELLNIGEILSHQGRLEEAETHLREAEAIWRGIGSYSVADATSELGRIAFRSGRFDDALELLAQARQEYVDAGAYARVVETDARTSECLALMGESDRALDLVSELSDWVRANGAVADVRTARLERIRGYAQLGRGRLDEAREALEASVDAGRAEGPAYEFALALAALSDLPDSGADTAEELIAESQSILDRLGVISFPKPSLVVDATA